MLRILMIGLMLSVTFSCSQAVIKEPQPTYVINTKTLDVAYGLKNFNYRSGHDLMSEWVDRPKIIKWSEVEHNIIGFPLEVWLTKIKPALKYLARKHRDDND